MSFVVFLAFIKCAFKQEDRASNSNNLHRNSNIVSVYLSHVRLIKKTYISVELNSNANIFNP